MLLPIKLTDGVVKNIDGDPQQLLCIGLLHGMEIKSAQSSIIYPMSMVTEIQYNQSTNKMHLICDMCLFQLILASLLPIHTFFSNTEYVSNCLAGDLVGIWNSYVLMIS